MAKFRQPSPETVHLRPSVQKGDTPIRTGLTCSSADQTSWIIHFVTFLCNGFLDGRT